MENNIINGMYTILFCCFSFKFNEKEVHLDFSNEENVWYNIYATGTSLTWLN